MRAFWTVVYQSVMEGMFSDPIYGGNRNKAGWKLIGFPGAIAVHRENVERYRDKEFPNNPLGIADMSLPFDVAELAAHAHAIERILNGALERGRQFGDRQLDEIEARFVHAYAYRVPGRGPDVKPIDGTNSLNSPPPAPGRAGAFSTGSS